MRYYPVFLDVAGKPVVVVGGGNVAWQKVEGLVDAGAEVTVISPDLLPEIQQLVNEGRVKYIAREYKDGDMDGYFLAFVATDDRSENSVVAKEAREKRIWINAVDDIPNCDFIMPGIIRRGELILAISTSGTSPAMARKVREDLEAFLTEEDAMVLDLAAEVRRELAEQGVAVKGCDRCDRNNNDVWNAALDAEVKKLVAEGQRPAAKERLIKSLLAPSGQYSG
jgi:precorrin-2 dehydrogenase / sirohydrochlorin ferrochelatase